jgi:hypothetical protein
VRIPVGSKENRVVRPPRQTCHREGFGANRFNRHNREDRHRAEEMEKSRDESGGNERRNSLPQVSFNV